MYYTIANSSPLISTVSLQPTFYLHPSLGFTTRANVNAESAMTTNVQVAPQYVSDLNSFLMSTTNYSNEVPRASNLASSNVPSEVFVIISHKTLIQAWNNSDEHSRSW